MLLQTLQQEPWELVSMTYNGMTVGKEDLEEMGTAMTLELLEDGTGTMDYDGTVYDLTWDDSSITMEMWQILIRWRMVC